MILHVDCLEPEFRQKTTFFPPFLLLRRVESVSVGSQFPEVVFPGKGLVFLERSMAQSQKPAESIVFSSSSVASVCPRETGKDILSGIDCATRASTIFAKSYPIALHLRKQIVWTWL